MRDVACCTDIRPATPMLRWHSEQRWDCCARHHVRPRSLGFDRVVDVRVRSLRTVLASVADAHPHRPVGTLQSEPARWGRPRPGRN